MSDTAAALLVAGMILIQVAICLHYGTEPEVRKRWVQRILLRR